MEVVLTNLRESTHHLGEGWPEGTRAFDMEVNDIDFPVIGFEYDGYFEWFVFWECSSNSREEVESLRFLELEPNCVGVTDLCPEGMFFLSGFWRGGVEDVVLEAINKID